MEGKDRECLEKLFAEKVVECETLKKRILDLENENQQISKFRLEAQECDLKFQLSISEKEKLLEAIRAQLEEVDKLKSKLSSSESSIEKLTDIQKENEELKLKVCSLEKRIEELKNSSGTDTGTETGNNLSNDITILLTKQIDELTISNQIYQKQVEMLNNQKSSLTIELETMKFQIKKLEAIIKEFENKLDESSSQKEEENKNIIEKNLIDNNLNKQLRSKSEYASPDSKENSSNILPKLLSSDFAKKIIIRDL